jgi:transposase
LRPVLTQLNADDMAWQREAFGFAFSFAQRRRAMEAGDLQGTVGLATIYVALELSRSSWLVAIQGSDEERPSRYKVGAGDAKRVLALIAQARCAAARRCGKETVRVCSCYEAGYEGFWLHRVLVAAGVESHVVDASSLLVDRRARRRKTDRIDVEAILRALIRWRHGDRDVCSMVVVPDAAAEDERRLSRERGRMIQERTGHINRIKGLLMTVGIYDFQPVAADRLERLAGLVTGDGRKLPPRLSEEIRRELGRLAVLEEQIAIVERERDKRSAKDEARSTDIATPAGRIAHLQKLRAVGPQTAAVLQSEVFFRQFGNRRQIASYVGLDPSPWRSGDTMREQGISKAGNRRARHALIELAWMWLQWQPASELAQWFHKRVGEAKGRLRRTIVVALARKLLIAIWRFLEHGVVPAGAVLRA